MSAILKQWFKKVLYLKVGEYRKEYKLSLSNAELNDFKFFHINELRKIYKSRVITSWYFDTNEFKLYKDSQSNDVDKFKIRFRKYSNEEFIYKEIKENTSAGRYKKVEKTLYKNIEEVKSLTYKGLMLTPSLKIQYNRDYYEYKNARVTFDTKINFESTQNRSQYLTSSDCDINIVEFKILNAHNPDIENNIPLNTVSFSKYLYGIKAIYNL